ncbi:hypothetical protein D1614_20315 [Maribellus luteus]|uniref:Uncharacterized protein n=1 Tax=Maribellus luteus TaxID=2305463 RepID=A0A399SVX2_9BACT|nr:anti-phage defense-associated sirtuin Dsr2 [Maribellus luteus]RIJ46073.1 hypothetical protein D1614_20315 [Maribellus luteus]
MNSQTVLTYIQEIAEKLESGHASVMVGAGFSKNASEKFPLWNDLGIAFYKKLHSTVPRDNEHFLNPMKLAGEIKEGFGYQTLFEIIKSNIPDKEYKPSDLHLKLLKLPWKDIFTTNYDTLLERASEQVIDYRFDIVRTKTEIPFSNNPRIIKLHGCLDQQKELTITDDDYREYPQKFAPFVNTVLQSLLENTLCLIGFSGEDPNFLNWINWILNNLGTKNSPKIYLIGKLEINEHQKKWLERRYINLVDLNYTNDKSTSHKKCLISFVEFLDNYLKEKNKINWPGKSRVTPQINASFKSQVKEIIIEWTKIRKNYPKWLIVPEANRERLWNHTQHWLSQIKEIETLNSPDDFNFVYEMNWRLEKCLYPIEDPMIKFYEKVLERYSPGESEYASKCIELRLSLLRYYREEAQFNKWEDANKSCEDIKELFTPELSARWQYEKVLYHLFKFDFEKCLEILQEWPRLENLSYWEIKKGCLLAELGNISDSYNIIENSIKEIRKRLNLMPIKNDFELVSLESYSILLSSYISISKGVIEKNYDNIGDNRKEEFERLDVLKLYKCAPWDEIKLFELKLLNGNSGHKDQIEKYGFELGSKTKTVFWGPKTEFINATCALRFYEEVGIPMGLPSVNIPGKKAINSAIQIVSSISSHWAFVTLIRTGDIELGKQIFNRISISKISNQDIDNLAKQYLEILNYSFRRLNSKSNPSVNPEKLCKILPEIISRLLSKVSTEIKDEFLNQILNIYNSDKKWVCNLKMPIKRLINSYKQDELIDRISVFLKFPIIKQELNQSDEEFPEPFSIEYFSSLTPIKLKNNELKLDNLISLVRSEDITERTNALLRIRVLLRWGLVTKEQTEILGKDIWTKINPENGFPHFPIFYKNAYLSLPHPKNISPASKVKKYINSSSPVIQNGKESFEHTNGDIEWCNVLLNSTKTIGRKDGIKWTTNEIITFLNKLNVWWNQDKNYLLIEDKDNFFSQSKEIHRRFSKLVSILAEIIFPNLSVTEIDNALIILIKELLADMEEYKLPSMKAKVASLILFPEDINNVEIQILEKISESDSSQAKNTFQGIFFNVLAHKFGKSILLSNTIFEAASEIIKWRSQPGLFYALDLFGAILRNYPELLNKKMLENIAIGLRFLISDTDIKNENSFISPLEERILIREFSAALSFELNQYYSNNQKGIPEVINEWENICKDSEEFIEIRKQWKI